MKKLLMILLAAAIVFGFAACEDSDNGPKVVVVEDATTAVSIPEQTDPFGDKPTSDFIEAGATIDENGTITAVLKATAVEGFNDENPEEEEGYYLPLKFTYPEGTTFTINGRVKTVDADQLHFQWIGGSDFDKTKITEKNFSIDFQTKDGIERVNIDLSGCTLATE